MSETKQLSPAARIVSNPFDGERNRLQEAVIEAALAVQFELGGHHRWAVYDADGLVIATAALRDYTAPKHKPPAPARRRREDRVLPKKAAAR